MGVDFRKLRPPFVLHKYDNDFITMDQFMNGTDQEDLYLVYDADGRQACIDAVTIEDAIRNITGGDHTIANY